MNLAGYLAANQREPQAWAGGRNKKRQGSSDPWRMTFGYRSKARLSPEYVTLRPESGILNPTTGSTCRRPELNDLLNRRDLLELDDRP